MPRQYRYHIRQSRRGFRMGYYSARRIRSIAKHNGWLTELYQSSGIIIVSNSKAEIVQAERVYL